MKKIIIIALAIIMAAAGSGAAASPISLFPGETGDINRNPARLGLTDHDYAYQIDPLYAGAYTNAWTFNEIFTNLNAYLDQSRKQEILGAVSSQGLGIGAEFSSGFAFGRNNWGLRTGLQGFGAASLDKEILELILEGTATTGETSLNLQVDNTRINAEAVIDTAYARSLSYADVSKRFNFRRLDELLAGWDDVHFGWGVHHLLGLARLEGGLTGSLDLEFTDETTIAADGSLQLDYTTPSDGLGQGLAVDFGFWGSPRPDWQVGFAVKNLGFVRWPGATRYSYEEDLYIKLESADNIGDGFRLLDAEGSEISDLNDLIDSEEVTEEKVGSYMTASPFSIQLDAVYDIHPRIDIGGSIGYHQAPRSNFSLAMAGKFLYPKFMPITLGISYDSFRKNLSLPFSLSFKTARWQIINLYISDLRMIPAHGRGLTVGLSTGFTF